MSAKVEAKCRHCGKNLSPQHKGPCPNCGKTGKDIKVALTGTVNMFGTLNVQRARQFTKRNWTFIGLASVIAIASSLATYFFNNLYVVLIGLIVSLLILLLGPPVRETVRETISIMSGKLDSQKDSVKSISGNGSEQVKAETWKSHLSRLLTYASMYLLLLTSGMMVYLAIVISIARSKDDGYGYLPFVVAGVCAALGGLVFTIAHLDKTLKVAQDKLVRIGELYALAAISITFFGLIYIYYAQLSSPFDVYYLPFLFVVTSLAAFSALLVTATFWFIKVLWVCRKGFLRN